MLLGIVSSSIIWSAIVSFCACISFAKFSGFACSGVKLFSFFDCELDYFLLLLTKTVGAIMEKSEIIVFFQTPFIICSPIFPPSVGSKLFL